MVLLRPGNAGGGKDPDFWRAFNGGEETVIGDEPANTRTDPDPPAEAVSHGEGGSAPHGALARHPPLRLRSGVRQARRASAAPDACGAPPCAGQSESRMREIRTSGLMSGDGK